MGRTTDTPSRSPAELKGIAILLFSIQLTMTYAVVDTFVWLLFAGVLLGVVGLIVAMLS